MRFFITLLFTTMLGSSVYANQDSDGSLRYLSKLSMIPMEHIGRSNEISTPCFAFMKKAESYLREFEQRQISDFELIRCVDGEHRVYVSFIEFAPITKEQIEEARLNPDKKLVLKHGIAIEVELSKTDASVKGVFRVK